MFPLLRKVRFRAVGLAVLALAAVFLISSDAHSSGVLHAVSDRLRFHAIPVALSQFYHGREHDYTAHRSLAMKFQSEAPLQNLLDEYSRPGIPVEGTYYWAADDRGLSDYVYAAFALFGPRVASFGKLSLLVVLISSLLFIIAHWKDTKALTFLVFALCSFDVLTSVLAIAATVVTPEGALRNEPVSLSESRIFDLLSFVAFLHFLLFCVRRHALSALTMAATIAQVILFVLLYHARSSLGWQVLAVGVVALVYALRALSVVRPFRVRLTPEVVRPLLPPVLLALGLLCLFGWQRWAYHPRYFQDMGTRTFWHNALMGFSHPKIAEIYGTAADDRLIIALVLKHMRERNDPRLGAGWDVDNALCSLGGHATFDWATYEQVAREVYWGIWRDHPRWALSNYLVYKPAETLRPIGQAMWPSAVGHLGAGADAFRYTPFRPWALALVLAALALVRSKELPGMGKYWGPVLLILPFSLIPSIAFYPALTTLMGLLMTLTLAVYLGLAWVATQVRGRRWSALPT
jgi:hypothetical protein